MLWLSGFEQVCWADEVGSGYFEGEYIYCEFWRVDTRSFRLLFADRHCFEDVLDCRDGRYRGQQRGQSRQHLRREYPYSFFICLRLVLSFLLLTVVLFDDFTGHRHRHDSDLPLEQRHLRVLQDDSRLQNRTAIWRRLLHFPMHIDAGHSVLLQRRALRSQLDRL